MKLFIKDLFSKPDQICSFLPIWSHLLKKSLMENFIFCALLSLVGTTVGIYFIALQYSLAVAAKHWYALK